MNAMHLHLVLNHVPVFGTVFGLALLLAGLVRRSEDLKRAGFAVLVLTALVAVPVYLTGEPAEKAVAGLPGVSKGIIETHEAAAGVAFAGLSVLGLVALGLRLWSWRKAVMPRWMGVTVLTGAVVVSGLMAWTANLGGQVRHTEARSGAAAQSGGADRDEH